MGKQRISKSGGAAFSASPAADVQFHEYGISGISRYGAVSRVYDEFTKSLQGPQGMKLYREAIDNDPIIGAILFAIQFLSRSVTFRIEPAEMRANMDSNRALATAERVKGALFDDLDVPWPDQLSEILTMAGYGWAFTETVYKKCAGMARGTSHLAVPPLPSGTGSPVATFAPSRFDDGFIGWKSWGLRAQDTLFMWEWGLDSRATVMQQMAPPDYAVRRIPLAKGLLFRPQLNKQSPEGRSIIRNAIPSYLIKKNLQLTEAIGIERDLAGYPVISTVAPDINTGVMPPDLWNTENPKMVALLSQTMKMVKAVRRDEQEGMVLPWWMKFDLITSGGSRAFDTSKIISRYDKNIAISVLADFIMLGHESVGSKALASTKSAIFTTALSAILDSVCGVINRFAIPDLLSLNGIPQEYAPKLAHGNPENIPLEALGSYIKSLAAGGFNLAPDDDLKEALLQAAKLPTSGAGHSDQDRRLTMDNFGIDSNTSGNEQAARDAADEADEAQDQEDAQNNGEV